MTEDFELSRWTDRLAASLTALAPKVSPRVPHEEVDVLGQVQGYTRMVSYDEYRALAMRARDDPDAEVAFEESYLWFDDDPAEVKAVLREHPVIRQALGQSDQDQSILFVGPYRLGAVKLKTLALSLTKLAIKTDGRNASQVLHRFLTLGEAHKLRAYEVTLFYGLKMDRLHDIGDGAFLAPYEDAKAVCGELPFSSIRHLAAGIQQSHPSDEAPTRIAALVRELTWGPAIASTEAQLETTLTTHFRFSVDDELIEDSYTDPSATFHFPRDHETVRDFLCIATGKHQIARQQYVRVDRWMEDLDPNVKFGWTRGSGWVNDWWKENHLSEDGAEGFLNLIQAWRTYRGDRHQLGLAIRRLAALPSRIGRLGTEDRILDTAIALEIMYGVDKSEITYKLKTRAGYFLGNDAQERMEIFGKVNDFYEARSAIVHGPKRRRRRIDHKRALSDGYGIAHETLQKLLHEGCAPNWNSLVMSAGDGGQVS